MSVEIARTADDKKVGMSVADLRLFLAEVDRAGIPNEAVLQIRVGFKSQLHRIAVAG